MSSRKTSSTKEPAVIGVDPGASGACCLLTKSNDVHFLDLKGITQYADIALWYEVMIEKFEPRKIIIEDVHSIYGMSAKSNFNFGKNVGILHGIFSLTGVGVDTVPPKNWQSKYGVKSKGKLIKKEVANIGVTKYPNAELYGPRGGLLDGRSDALGIAFWGVVRYL